MMDTYFTTLLIGILKRLLSNVSIVTLNPINACFNDIVCLYIKSFPCRLNRGCAFSCTINCISPGVMPGRSSPSLGYVIFVPAFQPGFTRISSCFESSRVV